MFKTTLSVALVTLGVLGLSACDVRQTQEGSVTLPKYEVEKTKEGNVTLPKYDVTTPDVKVGTTEKTVTVPTITTTEKKVEMPTISVTSGSEKAAEKDLAKK
jgi:hypothetical protein